MAWFKVILRRKRIVTHEEEKVVAVHATSEDEVDERIEDLFALDPDPGEGWDRDCSSACDEAGDEDLDDAPEDSEVVGEITSDDEMNVCSARIELSSAPKPKGKRASQKPKSRTSKKPQRSQRKKGR